MLGVSMLRKKTILFILISLLSFSIISCSAINAIETVGDMATIARRKPYAINFYYDVRETSASTNTQPASGSSTQNNSRQKHSFKKKDIISLRDSLFSYMKKKKFFIKINFIKKRAKLGKAKGKYHFTITYIRSSFSSRKKGNKAYTKGQVVIEFKLYKRNKNASIGNPIWQMTSVIKAKRKEFQIYEDLKKLCIKKALKEMLKIVKLFPNK